MARNDKRSLHSDLSLDPDKKREGPTFVSHIDAPSLHPPIKTLCDIITNTPSQAVEKALDGTRIRVSHETVEQVLKFSYSHPGSALKFFRWSAHQLDNKHSPFAWNLVVDLLGKNCLFDAMWDVIKSMNKENVLSLATFASVFSSYVVADRVKDAIMTFDIMQRYGFVHGVFELNSLLSAICRDGKTVDAWEFLHVIDGRIRPDNDTYAILLEGWEKERDVVNVKKTFWEMVVEVGWDPENVPAYDSYLITLLKGRDGVYEAVNALKTMIDRGCNPGMRFFKFAFDECLKDENVRAAEFFWEAMAGQNSFRPDTQMYNMMISLYFISNDTGAAKKLLNEMVYNGAFPDKETYNILFLFLVRCRNLTEASDLFNEMVEKEFLLYHENCRVAVRVYMDFGDPYVAMKVWEYMIENHHHSDLSDSGNILVGGLCDMHFLPEAVKYTYAMADKGITVTPLVLSKLKQSLIKASKETVYENLLRKCKAHWVG